MVPRKGKCSRLGTCKPCSFRVSLRHLHSYAVRTTLFLHCLVSALDSIYIRFYSLKIVTISSLLPLGSGQDQRSRYLCAEDRSLTPSFAPLPLDPTSVSCGLFRPFSALLPACRQHNLMSRLALKILTSTLSSG